jgi:alpha-tubulin suppressor-like RCC1 family protein
MHKKITFIILLFVLTIFISSCQEIELPDLNFNSENKFSIDEHTPYREGDIVIKLSENKSSVLNLFSSNSQKLESEYLLSQAGIISFDTIRINKKENTSFLNLGLSTYETWIHARYDSKLSMEEVMYNLSQIEEVIHAEPNYEFQYTINGSYKLTPPAFLNLDLNNLGDPLRDTQYALDIIEVDKVRAHLESIGVNPGGSRDVVVAVIDSGVDYNHEDLKNNMWINPGEIPGDGIDNDGNGIIDDIHGANFVSDERFHSGDPFDDNGHGTHVAGIIAAEANNGLGIEGIAYNTQIMAVKVGNNGALYATDIAEGIYYAYEMGAEVINMSIGAYVNMILIEDALSLAFSNAVLVGAAANDGYINLPHPFGASFYPAAYPFVVGAMATNGYSFAGFSNFDFIPYDAHEYALSAPGVYIQSTIPGNRYAQWSGTSMAAPVISGVAALVRSAFDPAEYKSRFVMGQLEGTADPEIPLTYQQIALGVKWPIWNQVNAFKAVTTFPEPFVHNYDFIIFDDVEFDPLNNNGDGVMDSGETIHIALLMRNHWGRAHDLKVTIDNINNAGFNDPYSTVVQGFHNYGNVSSFSTVDNGLIYEDGELVGVENPYIIKLSEDIPNDYQLIIRVSYETKNGLDLEDETIFTQGERKLNFRMVIRNGIELPSVISEDMVLTNENYYIIPNAVKILEGVTVTVLEGTKIQFWSAIPESPYAEKPMAQLQVDGKLIIEGSAENPVEIFPSEIYWGHEVKIYENNDGKIIMNYVEIVNPRIDVSHIKHGYFRQNLNLIIRRYYRDGDVYDDANAEPQVYAETIDSSIFWRMTGYYDMRYNYHPYRLSVKGYVTNSLFDSNHLRLDFEGENNVFLGNFFRDMGYYDDYQLSTSGMNFIAIEPRRDNFLVETVFKNEDLNKTYMVVSSRNFDRTVEDFAAYLGGYLADIGSENENNFIKDNIKDVFDKNHAVSGIMFGAVYDIEEDAYVKLNGSDLIYENWSLINSRIEYNYNPLLSHYPMIYKDGTWYKDYYNDQQYYLIEIDHTSLSINNNITMFLNVETQIEDIINLNYTDTFNVEISNSDILEYSNGTFITKSSGSTTITLSTKDFNYSEEIIVNVIDFIPITSGEIELNEYLNVNEVLKYTVDVEPLSSTEHYDVISSNEDVIYVNQMNHTLIALSPGQAKIKLLDSELNVLFSKDITVYENLENVIFEKDIYYMNSSDHLNEIKYYFSTNNIDNYDVIFESSDETIAKINELSQIEIYKEGNVRIRVTHKDSGVYGEALVTIDNNLVNSNYFIDVQATQRSVFGLTDSGKLWKWGGSINNKIPQLINIQNVKFIDTSQQAAIFITESGEAYTYYDSNQLIQKVENLSNVVSGSVFYDHGGNYNFTFLKDDNTIWAFGFNNYNQLGNSSATRFDDLIEINGTQNVIKILSIGHTVLYLTSEGKVYYTGLPNNVSSPRLISSLVNIVSIESSNHYCGAQMTVIAKDSKGNFYYIEMGNGINVSLLNESTNQDLVKTSNFISELSSDVTVLDYVNYGNCYYSFSNRSQYILTSDGNVYSQGSNFDGQLGLGDFEDRNNYDQLNLSNITKVVVSRSTVMALNEEGQIYVWGHNENYQVGNLNYSDTATPYLVPIGLYQDNENLIISNITYEESNELMNINSDIVIHFNKSINVSSNYFNIRLKDENGNFVSLTRTVKLNTIILSPNVILKTNNTYTLEIPSNAVVDQFARENELSNYTINTNSIVPNSDNIVNQEADIEILDTLYTVSYIYHEFYQFVEMGLLSAFSNNAILNHLHDTEMDGWLRFYANQGEKDIYVTGNYFGTASVLVINKHAIDFDNFQILDNYILDPFLLEPNEAMYPFVTKVEYFDASNNMTNTLGIGEMTFKIHFNRDMNMSIQPLVFFGQEYPYTDYVVSGDWESERVWMGTFRVSALTGDGIQYLRIRDAYAKDSQWLRTGDDDGRFIFNIATFTSESINLATESLEGSIKLTWYQDEIETLMGYNIYRSDSYNGVYKKINQTIVPYGEFEYLDYSVSPGQEYYYKYTIMQTDWSESKPSDIIIGAALDTLLPVVSHQQVFETIVGNNILISINAVDNVGVVGAKLYYKAPNESEYSSLDMLKGINNRYFVTISSTHVDITGVEYYFEVYDARNTYSFGTSEAPNLIVVKPQLQNVQYGDVNNDGFLTILDVLLILQAINESIILDVDAFLRADLNQDGILNSYEALIIMQYMTGTRKNLID